MNAKRLSLLGCLSVAVIGAVCEACGDDSSTGGGADASADAADASVAVDGSNGQVDGSNDGSDGSLDAGVSNASDASDGSIVDATVPSDGAPFCLYFDAQLCVDFESDVTWTSIYANGAAVDAGMEGGTHYAISVVTTGDPEAGTSTATAFFQKKLVAPMTKGNIAFDIRVHGPGQGTLSSLFFDLGGSVDTSGRSTTLSWTPSHATWNQTVGLLDGSADVTNTNFTVTMQSEVWHRVSIQIDMGTEQASISVDGKAATGTIPLPPSFAASVPSLLFGITATEGSLIGDGIDLDNIVVSY